MPGGYGVVDCGVELERLVELREIFVERPVEHIVHNLAACRCRGRSDIGAPRELLRPREYRRESQSIGGSLGRLQLQGVIPGVSQRRVKRRNGGELRKRPYGLSDCRGWREARIRQSTEAPAGGQSRIHRRYQQLLIGGVIQVQAMSRKNLRR